MPTPLARDRLARRLSLASGTIGPSRSESDRVYCWDDLWRSLRADRLDGPLVLSPAGTRAALVEAIDRARREGELTVSASVAGSSGFRRRVARRIAPWMSAGRAPDDLPAPTGAVELELHRIYRRYNEVLARLGAVDAPGLEAYYASLYRLTRELPRSWGRVDRLVLVEPPAEDRPVRLAIDAMRHSIRQLGVVLTFDGDPSRAEVDATAARFRERLLSWGFLEERIEPPEDRPAGLLAIGQALFREGDPGGYRIDRSEGIALRGASTGEGLARLAAVWARRLLDEGEAPEELIILVRSWDEQSRIALDQLRTWGLPVGNGKGRGIASDAAVQALRLAMTIPVEDWDTDLLGRLLRNGRLRPDWNEAAAHPMALAATAAALRETRVFRGRDAIAEAIDRMGGDPSPEAEQSGGKPDYLRRYRQRRSWLAGIAGPVFGRLSALIDAVAQQGPWASQVDRLSRLATGLGLDPNEEPLGLLFAALDDHGLVLDGVGRGGEPWTWAAFVAEVEAILRDLPAPEAPGSGALRMATVDEAAGVVSRHVLLTNLAEGAFPDRSAVGPAAEPDDGSHDEPEPGDDSSTEPDAEPGRAELGVRDLRIGPLRLPFDPAPTAPSRPTPFGREMARFLRVIGSAERSLTLAYPTADEKGVALSDSGFLAEVKALLTPDVDREIVREDRSLDPALRETTPQSPLEHRVRAMARAAIEDPSILSSLARSPEHRSALLASASALLVNERRARAASWRRVRQPLSRYEGVLRDPAIVSRLASDFGPEYAFSASQLESMAFCPFQFFLRYVLRLDPIEERDELEEDRTLGGSRMHAALESLHIALRDDPPGDGISLDEAVADRIELAVRDQLEREAEPPSDVGRALRAIEAERMVRVGKTYADQFRRYAESHGLGLRPAHFEFQFGSGNEGTGPALVIGEGQGQVRLQGMIDRIDVAHHPSGLLFRVIDYKTGSTPSRTKLQKGLALQLPLYAMAVERAFPPEPAPRALDAGYWALRGKGYTPLVTMAEYRDGDLRPGKVWEPGPEKIVGFVLDLVDRLRRGMLPVHPAEPDCDRTCDYRTVCRIHQVRQARKPWPEAPTMSDPDQPGEEDGR
ncbi:PD-(D/E)XK nuclease family protein [Tautonia sociabilis]|nr:PD-(D/E)XK nuclease family protein [Tautonia sociabilis]